MVEAATFVGIYVGESNHPRVTQRWCELDFVHSMFRLPGSRQRERNTCCGETVLRVFKLAYCGWLQHPLNALVGIGGEPHDLQLHLSISIPSDAKWFSCPETALFRFLGHQCPKSCQAKFNLIELIGIHPIQRNPPKIDIISLLNLIV